MFRSSARSRALLRTALVAAGTAVLLAGCVGIPTPVVTPTSVAEPDVGPVGGETPIPIETATPIEPDEPSTTGYTSLLDDFGVLTVDVPEDWTDTDGGPFTTDAGQEWVSIAASTDLDAYYASLADGYDVPGLEIAATGAQGVDDTQLLGLLESLSLVYGACETVIIEASPYDDGYFAGFESLFEGCGRDESAAFVIVAVDYDGTEALFVRTTITRDYSADEVYAAVSASFDTTVGEGRSSR